MRHIAIKCHAKKIKSYDQSSQKQYRVLGSQKKTSQIINASLVIKWDTLLYNVVQRRSRDANSCSVEEEEQKLASITISEDHINDNNIVNSSCSFCDDNFQLGEEAYRIQFCTHVYHLPCLLKWLLQQTNKQKLSTLQNTKYPLRHLIMSSYK